MSQISNYPAAQKCVDRVKSLVSSGTIPRVLIPMPGSSELEFAAEMSRDGLIRPILIGIENELKNTWVKLGDTEVEIIDAADSGEVRECTEQVIDGCQADIMLRGGLPIHEVVDVIKGSNGSIVSHAAAVAMPQWERFLVISDGGWILLPTLSESEGIVRNAITLLTALGVDTPKIAMLSAVEDIDSRIPRTMEAASISQMARRGAFDPAMVDGPLRFDHAIALPHGHEPPFISPVAGNADAVITGSLEEANVLIKALIHLGQGLNGGLLLGGTIPVAWHGRDGLREGMLLSLMMAILVWSVSKEQN